VLTAGTNAVLFVIQIFFFLGEHHLERHVRAGPDVLDRDVVRKARSDRRPAQPAKVLCRCRVSGLATRAARGAGTRFGGMTGLAPVEGTGDLTMHRFDPWIVGGGIYGVSASHAASPDADAIGVALRLAVHPVQYV